MKEVIERELQIFCENVKYLRERDGLTKREMCKIMRITPSTLNRLEAGEIPFIKLSALERLRTHFGLTLSELFQTGWRT